LNWPNQKLRLFISTGEVSGDLQGSLLIAALNHLAVDQALNLEILALGGDRMAQAGATLLGHTSRIGSVGLVESFPYVWPTARIQRQAKRYLQQHPPDLVVLIDYLGPNVSMGQFIHQTWPQVPVIYYIAPQEWVWSLSDRNTDLIAKFTHQLLAIFPEEARYFQAKGIPVTWVGHPLLDQIKAAPTRAQARASLGIAEQDWAITLVPASRQQELRYLLPAMFRAAQQIQAQLPTQENSNAPLFWIPLSLETYRPQLEQAIAHYGLNARIVPDHPGPDSDWQRRCAIAAADLAISKSGTVNLEIALMQVPQVVIYRVHPLTAWIARHILKFSIPFMSPPNLVLMQPLIPELLQEQATPENIAQESLELLLNPVRRQQIQQGYQQMRTELGEVGVCDRAAGVILDLMLKRLSTDVHSELQHPPT
jgi:lipid-A-disaccharide synthase